MQRRTFTQFTAAAVAAAGSAASASAMPKIDGIRIGDRLNPAPTDKDFAFFQQSGAEYATVWTTIGNATYEYMAEMRRKVERAGIQLLNIGILDLHCDPAMVLGLPEREAKIEQYKAYLQNLGRAGIGYTTYAHMANIKMRPYYQTGTGVTRGARTRLFDMSLAKDLPLSHGRVFTEKEIWSSFTTFIRAVMPVAEKAKVRIGLHPDDPPVDLGGVARIFCNADAYERAIQIADSENFGLCFCVGTWAEGGKKITGKDVYEMVQHFGRKKRIFKVHFRNVDQPLPRFQETFIDNGYVDMYRVMVELAKVNFQGVMIPDHVPEPSPANSAWALGHMRALRERARASARG